MHWCVAIGWSRLEGGDALAQKRSGAMLSKVSGRGRGFAMRYRVAKGWGNVSERKLRKRKLMRDIININIR